MNNASFEQALLQLKTEITAEYENSLLRFKEGALVCHFKDCTQFGVIAGCVNSKTLLVDVFWTSDHGNIQQANLFELVVLND